MDFEIPILGFPMENDIISDINVIEMNNTINKMDNMNDINVMAVNDIKTVSPVNDTVIPSFIPIPSSIFTFTEFSESSLPSVSTNNVLSNNEKPFVVKNMMEMDENPVLFHKWSISCEEIPTIPVLECSSRKSSIDLPFTCIPQEEEQLVSPVAPSIETSNNEMPPLQLPPSALSLWTLLQNQVMEKKARECKKRRKIRMEILKRKREEGLISFNSKIRYEQRSEFAMKRVRSSGRFITEIQYKSI